MKKDIVFICSGNTCRSPIAEYVFKDYVTRQHLLYDFQVSSAGLAVCPNMPAAKNAIAVMQEIGIDISHHRSRQLTQSIVDMSDAIICMTHDHHTFVINNFTNTHDKCYMISYPNVVDVHDPFAGTLDDYRHTRDVIRTNIDNILNILISDDN